MSIRHMHRNCIFSPSLATHSVMGFLALLLLAIMACAPAQAQTFTVIHNFTGVADGKSPGLNLVVDGAGNIYGTAFEGGADGFGVVYELSRLGSGWTTQTLYNFQGNAKGDGSGPAGITLGSNGVLYGVTQAGGNGGCFGIEIYPGCGTVFGLDPATGQEEVLYRFTGGSDGLAPFGIGQLTLNQGSIYGTAFLGGQERCIFGFGCGAAFELTPSGNAWSESSLWDFGQGTDGAEPTSDFIMDRSGNLYGTTLAGGTGGGCSVQGHTGCGTVYRLSPPADGSSNWTETILYSFRGKDDGGAPYPGLVADASGNIYGATAYGGSGSGGTVFELSPAGDSWQFILLHAFAASGAGANGQCLKCPGPHMSLTSDGVGNLYGTTYNDGAFGQGSVFRLSNSGSGWQFTDLHDFTGGNDGGSVWAGVVLDASGNLYGVADAGGANGDGVAYEIVH